MKERKPEKNYWEKKGEHRRSSQYDIVRIARRIEKRYEKGKRYIEKCFEERLKVR